MAIINIELLRKAAMKAAAPRFIDAAYDRAGKAFEKAKSEMIEEFEEHPVTQEIKLGPHASNISKTLGGEGSEGNLFSFIGFEEEDEDPTEVIKEILETDTQLEKTSSNAQYRSRFIRYSFPIISPKMKDIEAATPMPWENGKSWVIGIEKGISGLGNYIFKDYIASSRSSTGIQTKGNTGGSRGRYAVFKPVDYLSRILRNFIKKFRT